MTLTHAELLELKRWNTPTIYNGWEQITKRNPAADGFNLEETRDFMPQMGPMIGYAVTVVIEPSNKAHRETNVDAWNDYRRYVAGQPGPKIVCVQDLDKPRTIGSFWGEVNSNVHRALGCVGTIVDGAIRDVDEMTNAGFKALARRLCVGHAHVHPVRWNCEVDNFYLKQRVGLGDFRLQSYEAIDKFCTIAHLAWAYVQWRLAHTTDRCVRNPADVIRLHRDEHARDWLIGACQEAIACGTVAIVDCPVDYTENMRLTERLGRLTCNN